MQEKNVGTPCLWPWDVLHFLSENNLFLEWVADCPASASSTSKDTWLCLSIPVCLYLSPTPKVSQKLASKEYWQRLADCGEGFVEQLDLAVPDYTVPIVWHCDGVRVYKQQKAWIYSFSSAVRKGPSLTTKMISFILREPLMVKEKTNDMVGQVIGWIMRVLTTGKFPTADFWGNPWPCDSLAARRAGRWFANGWRAEFAAFKSDLEARVIVHKLTRNWMSNLICEHCFGGKLLPYGDFTDNAAWMDTELTHDQFLMINPPQKQSAWLKVRGWTKDRNLHEPWLPYLF